MDVGGQGRRDGVFLSSSPPALPPKAPTPSSASPEGQFYFLLAGIGVSDYSWIGWCLPSQSGRLDPGRRCSLGPLGKAGGQSAAIPVPLELGTGAGRQSAKSPQVEGASRLGKPCPVGVEKRRSISEGRGCLGAGRLRLQA